MMDRNIKLWLYFYSFENKQTLKIIVHFRTVIPYLCFKSVLSIDLITNTFPILDVHAIQHIFCHGVLKISSGNPCESLWSEDDEIR